MQAKNAATRKWAAALNNARRYGEWAYVYCDTIAELRGELLAQLPAGSARVLPFREVTPKDGDHFKTACPSRLSALPPARSATSRWASMSSWPGRRSGLPGIVLVAPQRQVSPCTALCLDAPGRVVSRVENVFQKNRREVRHHFRHVIARARLGYRQDFGSTPRRTERDAPGARLFAHANKRNDEDVLLLHTHARLWHSERLA